MAEDKTPPERLTRLRQQMVDRFSDQELRDLCQDMGIEYDDMLPGGRADKARELVARCERRGRSPTTVTRSARSLDPQGFRSRRPCGSCVIEHAVTILTCWAACVIIYTDRSV